MPSVLLPVAPLLTADQVRLLKRDNVASDGALTLADPPSQRFGGTSWMAGSMADHDERRKNRPSMPYCITRYAMSSNPDARRYQPNGLRP